MKCLLQIRKNWTNFLRPYFRAIEMKWIDKLLFPSLFSKYANSSEKKIKDDLMFLCHIRNTDGLEVSSGRIDAKYATKRLSSEELEILFEEIWRDVLSKHPRSDWFYEANRKLAKIQKEIPKSKDF